MTSGPRLRRTNSPTLQALRLLVKPKAAAMGMVDGAWWPRSRDPLAEFPAMIAGIHRRLGRPDRVAFNSSAWAQAPGTIVVDGQRVRLEGFRSLDEHTVLVSGRGWHRMALLVVPPESAEDDAVAALVAAADPANVEAPAEILVHSGIDAEPALIPAPRPALAGSDFPHEKDAQ
jgi:hypothetical protein